ncbi:tyrosine--tRNA ligase [Candidatus Parvarchaeota archaeon]|nr:MAG: tyrosine--tRNA ligase [Candidatus Parvarchaeota archaeon]PXY71603.1 MAG: tyrosine--tRNA ligase [Candidatus Parvarchaeota archaeon]
MNQKERLELIKKNTVEIIPEKNLLKVLGEKKKPVVYCGYEPSGPLHLGHFVTIMKLLDLQNAGFKVKILLADVHALLNKKGDRNLIKREVAAWKKTLKAINRNFDIILGSEFQFEKNYQISIMNLARDSTINRGLRSMQEIARDIENASISQLWYPLMQIADIKNLKADFALGGLEQRKVHMLGKDLSKTLGHEFIAIHTPLITSLKGPGEKMSKSLPGSGISITETKEEIKKILKKAYCPEKEISDNPILQISKLIIFPKLGKLEISRPEKFGGNKTYNSYSQLESDFSSGKLHPQDLKNSAGESLEKIIAPIRKNFKS